MPGAEDCCVLPRPAPLRTTRLAGAGGAGCRRWPAAAVSAVSPLATRCGGWRQPWAASLSFCCTAFHAVTRISAGRRETDGCAKTGGQSSHDSSLDSLALRRLETDILAGPTALIETRLPGCERGGPGQARGDRRAAGVCAGLGAGQHRVGLAIANQKVNHGRALPPTSVASERCMRWECRGNGKGTGGVQGAGAAVHSSLSCTCELTEDCRTSRHGGSRGSGGVALKR